MHKFDVKELFSSWKTWKATTKTQHPFTHVEQKKEKKSIIKDRCGGFHLQRCRGGCEAGWRGPSAVELGGNFGWSIYSCFDARVLLAPPLHEGHVRWNNAVARSPPRRSRFRFKVMARSNNRLIVFDTTLRDGEQSPGVCLNSSQKLEILKNLIRLGVGKFYVGVL